MNTEKLAHYLRLTTLDMVSKAGASHVGGNFSAVDILAVLYNEILNISPETQDSPERDRFVLGKGHIAASYYALLAEMGYFPKEWLNTFYQNGGKLAGHTSVGIPGVEVATGALGHALPIACGIALAGKRDEKNYRTFVLLSDGECDEGSVWEAAMFAAQNQLDNLTVIIDYNKLQALGYTKDVINLEPFADKWRAFGWATVEVDGHNIVELKKTFQAVSFEPTKPSCIIAHTIKGKGVSFMEDQVVWHYRIPRGEEYEKAKTELLQNAPCSTQ